MRGLIEKDVFERAERQRQNLLTINGIGPQGSRIDREILGDMDNNPIVLPNVLDPRNEKYMNPMMDAMDKDRDYLGAAQAVVQRHRDEQAPGGIDYRPTPRGEKLREELIMIEGEKKMKEFSEKMAALQEMRERYNESRSGREQTSRANTPRVQPSNPAKVKTPHATGIGGGGGGQNLFEMIGMSMQMFPLWRAKNG